MVRRRGHPSRPSDSEPVANGAIKMPFRTMLRIAGRTMRAPISASSFETPLTRLSQEGPLPRAVVKRHS
jgi:hypothetical protein